MPDYQCEKCAKRATWCCIEDLTQEYHKYCAEHAPVIHQDAEVIAGRNDD